MPKLRAAFFAIIILTSPGIGASAAKADRCQETSNYYSAQYTALANRRLQVGQTELSPSPFVAGPEYCKLTRQMLSVATEWAAVMPGCGAEWRTPTKRAKGRNLVRTAREQLRVACPSTNSGAQASRKTAVVSVPCVRTSDGHTVISDYLIYRAFAQKIKHSDYKPENTHVTKFSITHADPEGASKEGICVVRILFGAK
jgi:hypothetical protein